MLSRNYLFLHLQRAQVLISGAVHGDERVGTAVSLHVAKLLVSSAECVIQKDASACGLLSRYAISDADRDWLAVLATQRDVYIVPAANCYGYIRRNRFDVGGKSVFLYCAVLCCDVL